MIHENDDTVRVHADHVHAREGEAVDPIPPAKVRAAAVSADAAQNERMSRTPVRRQNSHFHTLVPFPCVMLSKGPNSPMNARFVRLFSECLV